MIRMFLAFFVFASTAVPVSAHFIWLAPQSDGTILMVFSDSLEPDKNVPIAKIAATKLHARPAAEVVRTETKENAFRIELRGKHAVAVGGTCEYGVLAKKGSEPFLLLYHPRTLLGKAGEADPHLPLQIVPTGSASFRVLWRGTGAPHAEFVAMNAAGEKIEETKTDAEGHAKLAKAPPAGWIGLRAKHSEAKEGEKDGKTYKEIRHYATLTYQAGADGKEAKEAKKADPKATALLTDAREARAEWNAFPGFSADILVAVGERSVEGKAEVDAKGKVHLILPDEDMKTWVRREIASLVGHRLPLTIRETPCVFGDEADAHPQGRLVRIVADELHSSYRIRDRQILEVNRRSEEGRFTITVLENAWNADKKVLPRSYVVNTWDAKTGELRSAVAYHQAWKRIGPFDMPASIDVVRASAGQLESRRIVFRNLALKGSAE